MSAAHRRDIGRGRRARATLLAVLAALAIAGGCAEATPSDETPACSSSDDCPDRGLCVDGACQPCDVGLPEPNDACLPRCGNDIGVGQPCTAGGGECTAFLAVGGASFCTIDFVPDADLHMCTRPCADDADCGPGAVCDGDPEDPDGDKGCVPSSCAATE